MNVPICSDFRFTCWIYSRKNEVILIKLVIITGAAAVGKMTVGQELCKITDLRLFHNHMTIEPVIEIFGCYKPDTIERLRKIIFEDFAKSDNYGLVFTCMFAFDCKDDWDYLNGVISSFPDAEIYFVELVASQEIRLQRNKTENRLKNKPSKRNSELSDALLMRDDENYRLESLDGEVPFENYIKIDNTYLAPETVAQMIKERFSL